MDWLKQIAPTIATAMGGPLAGMAVSAISKAIGVDPDKVDLITKAQAQVALRARAYGRERLRVIRLQQKVATYLLTL